MSIKWPVTDFQYPQDEADAEVESVSGKAEPVAHNTEAFKHLLMLCIPSPHSGIPADPVDRVDLGRRRICVLTYELAPQFFGNMTKVELAERLGLTRDGLMREFRAVRKLLATAQAKTNCKSFTNERK